MQGQALVHLLAKASVRGLIVRGPMVGRQQAFVRVSDWLGRPPALFLPANFDRVAALAELARRYLAGHAPAGERDLAKWAGIPLGDARRGLAAIASELNERPDGLAELAAPGGLRAPALADTSGDVRPPPAFPPPRLLGSFDPLLHGWVAREPVLGAAQRVVTVNGLFRPFALAGGRAVAIWRLAGGQVQLDPFSPLPVPVSAALEADAGDVIRFLGL